MVRVDKNSLKDTRATNHLGQTPLSFGEGPGVRSGGQYELRQQLFERYKGYKSLGVKLPSPSERGWE